MDTSALAGLSVRKANFLDIPSIYDIMLDGSISGSFSDAWLIGAGHFLLVVSLFRAIGRQSARTPLKPAPTQLLVICHGDDEVGFAQVSHSQAPSGTPVMTINLFGIAREYRNRHLATDAIRLLIAQMPGSTMVVTYCTKYARAMQHVLTRLRFRRDKVMVQGKTRFVYLGEGAHSGAQPPAPSR